MRRIVVTGIALICVVILSSLAAATAPETSAVVAAPSQNAQPVMVTNFPSTQAVSGTVNVGNLPAVQTITGAVSVGNLPAVQTVAGSVQVANLPIDGEGNVRVAVPTIRFASGALMVRSTAAVYQGDLGGRTGATRKCQAEFPGSHFPHVNELSTAAAGRGIVWLSSDTEWSWLDDYDDARSCFQWHVTTRPDGSRTDGNLLRQSADVIGSPGPCNDAHPILCAE